MVGPLRAIARFCEKKIGWNRIGVLLSLTIIAVAADVLFHLLRNLDFDAVIAAIKATTPISTSSFRFIYLTSLVGLRSRLRAA